MIIEALSLLSVLLQCTAEPVQTNVKYDEDINYVSDSSEFIRIGGSSPSKVLECPDGYVYDQVDVFKHSYTESSDLYLYKVTAQFTPGVVANRNNTKRADGSSFNDAYLKNGFIHVAAYQYQEQEYGGEIVYKGMLPMSSESKTTITSSFGISLSFSAGKNEGIKVDGAGELGVSIGVSNATSLTFTYQESTSTVTDDPMLSAQYAYNTGTKKTEAQWDFSVLNERIGGGKTYTITSYLLFEMSNRVSYFNRDVFNAYIHYSFTGQTPYWLIKERWSEGKTCTGVNGGSYFK